MFNIWPCGVTASFLDAEFLFSVDNLFNTVKPLILAAINFRDSIYYIILVPLFFAFLLAGLSNTLK